MKKRIISLLIISTMILTLVACSKDEPTKNVTNNTVTNTPTVTEEVKPTEETKPTEAIDNNTEVTPTDTVDVIDDKDEKKEDDKNEIEDTVDDSPLITDPNDEYYGMTEKQKEEAIKQEELDELEWLEEEKNNVKANEIRNALDGTDPFHNVVDENGAIIKGGYTAKEVVDTFVEQGYDEELASIIVKEFALSPEDELKEVIDWGMACGITQSEMPSYLERRQVADINLYNADDISWSDGAYNYLKNLYDSIPTMKKEDAIKFAKNNGYTEEEINNALNKLGK